MQRLILLKAFNFEELKKAPDGEQRIVEQGIAADILGQYYDSSNQPIPGSGYRLTEFKTDNDLATFDHQGATTHERLSPWRVIKVEEYAANTGREEFDEIVVAYCEYLPLPEDDNPWIERSLARVIADSFGGDVEAFEQWKQAQQGVLVQ